MNPFRKNCKRLLVIRSDQMTKRFFTGQCLFTPANTPIPAYCLYWRTEPGEHQVLAFKKLAGKPCLGNRRMGVVMQQKTKCRAEVSGFIDSFRFRMYAGRRQRGKRQCRGQRIPACNRGQISKTERTPAVLRVIQAGRGHSPSRFFALNAIVSWLPCADNRNISATKGTLLSKRMLA